MAGWIVAGGIALIVLWLLFEAIVRARFGWQQDKRLAASCRAGCRPEASWMASEKFGGGVGDATYSGE